MPCKYDAIYRVCGTVITQFSSPPHVPTQAAHISSHALCHTSFQVAGLRPFFQVHRLAANGLMLYPLNAGGFQCQCWLGWTGDGVKACTPTPALSDLASQYTSEATQGPLICDVAYPLNAPGSAYDPTLNTNPEKVRIEDLQCGVIDHVHLATPPLTTSVTLPAP